MADTQLPDKTLNARDALLRTDDTFRQLVTEHQRLDERIRQLSTAGYLTTEEHLEASSLKKQKLALKDRIEAILRGGQPAIQH